MTTIAYRPIAPHRILARPLEDASPMELVGGKAYNLRRVIELGLRVPDGFVLTSAALELHLAGRSLDEGIDAACATVSAAQPADRHAAATVAARRIREMVLSAPIPVAIAETLSMTAGELLRHGPVVVRSSAIGEDSAQDSFAGQLDSFLHIRDEAALVEAVLACWASCWSERALMYRATRGVPARGMGVIVQRQVDARHAGVMFSTTSDNLTLVEFTAGLADALVAGAIDPARVAMSRDGSDVRHLAVGSGAPALSAITIAELARVAGTLEHGFGAPQDVEWVVDAEGVNVVQTRPITAAVRALTSQQRTTRWSNANVSENFPDPITPLLYSIATAGYAHYFRNLARAYGLSSRRIAAMDDALRHVVGIHSARLYYNLTSIHTILGAAPFGDALVSAFNRFVGTSGSEGELVVQPARGFRARLAEWRELAWIAVKTTWTYLTIERRLSGFERTIDDFAARTHPSRLGATPTYELRVALAELMDIRCNRWASAGLADAAAMVTYAMLHSLIGRAYGGKAPGSLHNSLLKAIPGLVSGEPVHRLWELSRIVRGNAALEALFRESTPAILAGVRNDPRFAEFRQAFDQYLEEWGFRCSAELMLTIPSFQEDPSALIDTIRSYVVLDGESPAQSLARQLAARESDTEAMLRTTRWRPVWRGFPLLTYAPVLAVVLRWTQAAIGLRERARLKQALLYSRCRRVVLALGDRLADAGLLARQDDVFWLTVSELDELASGSAMLPGQTASLIANRRAEHAVVSARPAPDSFTTYEGQYQPIADAPPVDDQHGRTDIHRGTGACGGRVVGRATVLADTGQAARLAQGDVLVTRQTDPGWAPVFFLISGLVIERGGMLSHGAIVAREFGIPCVVGVHEATSRLPDGGRIMVDGDRGEVHVLD